MIVQYRHTLPLLLKNLGLPLTAIEVGVAEGYNAKDLIENGIEHIYLIDLWESHPERFGDVGMPQDWHDKNYKDAMERLAPYMDKITILRGLTTDMAKKIPDGSVSLVYLDADHSYNGVMDDLIAFYPKLCKGGVMAGHDYLNEGFGVKRAVTDFVKGKPVNLIPENGDPNNASFYFIC